MEEKRVDEGWKAQVQQEKSAVGGKAPVGEHQDVPEVPPESPALTFNGFVSGLASQALMQMGFAQGPDGRRIEGDIDQASQLIDILQMLQDKTKGNLDRTEKETLDQILHELRLAFVRASGTPPPAGSPGQPLGR